MGDAPWPQGHAMAAFLILIVIAAVFAGTLREDAPARGAVSVLPARAIPLPDADQDRDTYGNDVDRWEGDLEVVLQLRLLRVPEELRRVYLLVGTQEDQWRLGDGAQLEWRRVVDHDPLGLAPGSPEWAQHMLRTGHWLRTPVLDVAHGEAQGLPMPVHVNVRDDRARVFLDVEAWDPDASPHRLIGVWRLHVDVPEGSWGWGASRHPAGTVSTATRGAAALSVLPALGTAIELADREAIAQRWAPLYHFTADERFFPVPGEALERFHGFAERTPDHATWSTSFNNGRHTYRLFLADFNGDQRVDHEDAAVMADILREGGVAPPTVYAHVARGAGEDVYVQYWSLYFYNYVLDDRGQGVPRLAHDGDREFIQLRFADLEAARNGTPLSVAYSQHYKGVVVPFEAGLPPFHVDAERPAVFVARGSHASYPVAGTDRAMRPALAGFGDVFFGDGKVLDDYHLEVLSDQPWHAGYLWGPVTRHARDLGTSTKPLLQHGFTYPFLDPGQWEERLRVVPAHELEGLYGSAP